MSETLFSMIKRPKADVFRRAYIKRRETGTGLFESDWQDITKYVKSWGRIVSSIDSVRLFKFTFGNLRLVMDNNDGLFNPHDDDSSLWNGYLNQQRTLVKIEAGFVNRTKVNNIWYYDEYPANSIWDSSTWDNALWDQDVVIFKGVISGDIPLSDKNEVSFNIKPLISVFQEYPATNLTGWTSTGMTASQFVTMLRDQTDGSGGFIFRPFFDDTTSSWDITSTTNVYANLNTSTAKDVFDKTVWDVVEKLSEAENFIPYVTRSGVFKFIGRDPNTTTAAFEFHGAGSFDTTYGQTIKKINSFGKKLSKYYSRVQVKWVDADTSTSYEVVQSSFSISPTSNPWILGHKTFAIENFYIPTSTVANTIAQTIFNDYSALKSEIDFTTSFVPQLDLLDRISITYDPTDFAVNSLWDLNNWAYDDTSLSDDLIFDYSTGDAIKLSGDEFKFLSIEINLDTFENKFIAREV